MTYVTVTSISNADALSKLLREIIENLEKSATPNFGELEKIFSGEDFFLVFFSVKELDRIFHFRYFRASTDLSEIIYSTFTFVILSKSTCTTPTLTLRFAIVHLAVASKKTITIYIATIFLMVPNLSFFL